MIEWRVKYEYCGEIHTKPLCTIVASIVDYFVYTPVVLCERWPVFVVRCLLPVVAVGWLCNMHICLWWGWSSAKFLCIVQACCVTMTMRCAYVRMYWYRVCVWQTAYERSDGCKHNAHVYAQQHLHNRCIEYTAWSSRQRVNGVKLVAPELP